MGPAVIGALGSLVGAGVSAAFSGRTSKKNLEYSVYTQQQENEKNRRHNLQLAMLQNRWNEDMYNKNNVYNSPIEQRRRLEAAGLNPDLMYGGNGQLAIAQPPAMTAGEGSHGSVNPPVAAYDPAGNISSMFDNAVKMAQVGLIKAQTKKANAEGDIAVSDASIRDSLNKGILDLQHLQLNLGGKDLQLKDGEIRKIQPIIDNLNASTESIYENINLAQANISSLKEDVVYKKIQNAFAAPQMKAALENMSSQTGLNYARCREIVTLLGARLLNLNADTFLKGKQSENFDADTGIKIANGVVARIEADKVSFDWSAQQTDLASGGRAFGAWLNGFLRPARSLVDALNPFVGMFK